MRDERGFTHLLCGEIHVRAAGPDDEVIAMLALRQKGVAGRRQLLDLGITRRAIDHRLAVGRLRVLHPGVYAVGHEALPYPARALAAVMSVAGGSGGAGASRAAASHLTAAALWELCPAANGPIHVSAERHRRWRPGIATHRAVLPAVDRAIVDGVPVTSVARTLLDLSAKLDTKKLRRLVKQAEFLGLTSHASVDAILSRYPRRPGRRPLARIVAGHVLAAGRTRSELEDRFLDFCARRGLPQPETNVRLEVRGRRLEVDCVWREAKLIVELDGGDAHGTDDAFHEDRARDRVLIADGWRPMRITWAHLHLDPDALESDIRDALRIRNEGGPGHTGRA